MKRTFLWPPTLMVRQIVPVLLVVAAGCQWFADGADREVYRLIESRQRAALGETHDARIERGKSPVSVPGEAYSFVPRPIDAEVPEAFLRPASQPAASGGPSSRPADLNSQGVEVQGSMPASTADAATTQPVTLIRAESARQPVSTRPARPIMTLSGALKYAFQHSRQFQNAKEDLYLAALDLTLERHLWTPQFFGDVGVDLVNRGGEVNWDHALEAVAQAGVRQKLPYGGEITARVLANLVNDLSKRVNEGESGSMIVEANVPLLRGAGRVAYESRYRAERNLIYAVRTYEQYRRSLAVSIAGRYFNLQRLRQEIVNARESVEQFANDMARAEALWRVGRVEQLDVLRADQDRLRAINTEVDAVAAYETSLDRFKIEIGMPTETEIDVDYPADITDSPTKTSGVMEPSSLEDALQMPDVPEEEAIRVALKYRLDFLNDMDRVDDAHRGVAIAENNLLPDLRMYGTVQMDTVPERVGALKYNTDEASYRTGMKLDLPLDRVAERNALRKSQIALQQAQRGLDDAKDVISLQVRESMREVQQQADSLRIQILSRDQALARRRAARLWFDLGKMNNRDVVEAQRELLESQNRLAEAQSQWRLAVLAFRLDTGTLRVDDEGQWYSAVASAAAQR
ncbi:MAG: TolC family protein [Planctomycetes bacterium]|nr:TolC family protein [Planctomycetota bacterium]